MGKLFLILSFSCLVGLGLSLKCYDCGTGPDCEKLNNVKETECDPHAVDTRAKSMGITLNNTNSDEYVCFTMDYKDESDNAKTGIFRGCADNNGGCNIQQSGGQVISCKSCNTNLCNNSNGAGGLKVPVFSILIAAILCFCVFKY